MDFFLSFYVGLLIGISFLVVYYIKTRKVSTICSSQAIENRLLKEEIEKAKQIEELLREEIRESDAERVEKATLNQELNKKLDSQIAEQEKLTKQMHEKFENLANKILEQKSAKFTEANKENIKSLLEPLDKDIRSFRKKVEDIHEKMSASMHRSRNSLVIYNRHRSSWVRMPATWLPRSKGIQKNRETGENLS